MTIAVSNTKDYEILSKKKDITTYSNVIGINVSGKRVVVHLIQFHSTVFV